MATASHERLRHWRKLREISQDELARRCEMPQSKISRIENGVITVTTEDLEVIVKELGLTMAEFYAASNDDSAPVDRKPAKSVDHSTRSKAKAS